MIDKRDPNVYDRNDYQPFLKLTHRDNNNNVVPTIGLLDLDVWLAATDDGDPIDPGLKIRATELSVSGYYVVTFPGAIIHTKMFTAPADYDKADVFVVARNVAGNVSAVERVKAFAVRRVSS